MNTATPRRLSQTVMTASILPAIYLFFATSTIIDNAFGGDVYMKWYSAEVVTIPMSVVVEMFAPQYSPGLVGFLFLAVLNACGIFVASYFAVRQWIRLRRAGWSLAPSRRTSAILMLSAILLWRLKGSLIYPIQATCGPIFAAPLSAFLTVVTIGLAVAAIRLWPSEPI